MLFDPSGSIDADGSETGMRIGALPPAVELEAPSLFPSAQPPPFPLPLDLIEQADAIEDMHFMLQKEVVDRIAAPPGDSNYGRLSVMMQFYCRVAPLFAVPASAFRPSPKVESAVIRLVPAPAADTGGLDHALFGDLVRRAFAQRRKTLRNSLRNLLSAKQMEACQIDPSARVEQLAVEDFVRLANVGCKIDPVT